MGLFALPTSLLLLGIIVLVEVCRKKRKCFFDFLFGVNIMYAVLFCVIPFFLVITQKGGHYGWGWMSDVTVSNSNFLFASLISIFGYLSLIFGYFVVGLLGGKVASAPSEPGGRMVAVKLRATREKRSFAIGIILGGIGACALVIYAYSIGGFDVMILQAAAFRLDNPPVVTPYAFLKNVAPFVLISSYVFFGLMRSSSDEFIKRYSKYMFIVMFVMSFVILFHQSGRLNLIAYLFIFPLSMMILKDEINKKNLVVGVCFFVFLTLFGKELFHFFINPDSIVNKVDSVSSSPLDALNKLLLEFSFPYVVLAKAIETVPADLDYRWFIDVPLAFAYLLPQRLLGLENLPPTVTMVNVELLNAPIPVDLLSFAYYSMGLPGVFIVCSLFGYCMKLLNQSFPPNEDAVAAIFRAAWIMFFTFNVMYGNPHHALNNGFPLILGTILLLLAFRERRKS